MSRKVKNFCLIVLVFLLVGLLLYIPRKIVIKNIVCTNQYGECGERVLGIVAGHNGQTLSIAKRQIKSDLSEGLVKKDIVFRYQYPSTLLVSVYETQPEFALSNNEANDFRLVDNEGNVLSVAEQVSLPFAKVNSDLPSVGDRLDQKYLFALRILRDLAKTYDLPSGTLANDGLLIDLPSGIAVLFPLEGDRDVLLGSFVLIMNQLNRVKSSSTMDKVSLVGKTLDLRFKDPIIR